MPLPETSSFLLFLAATIALNLTPGPDMLFTLANGIGAGKRAGVVSAMGIGGGTLVHTGAAALGLSALLMSSPFAFDAIRMAGAAYLVFLGVRSVLAARQVASGAIASKPTTLLSAFFRGIATNVLNPKVALFFLAFIPQFVDPARGSVVLQFLLLGTIFNVSGTIVNGLVGLSAGSVGGWLNGSPKAARGQRLFTGSVFVALGAKLALIR